MRRLRTVVSDSEFRAPPGVWLVDPVTGVVRKAKVVTGVDDS
jgi:hypothetical protein